MFSKIITSLAGQLFIVLLGLAIVSACSMRPIASTKPVNSLANTSWQLKKLEGYEEVITQIPSLNFTTDRLSGFNGCNRIFANYAVSHDGSISFGQLGSTRMACRDQSGEVEQRFNQALADSSLFAISRDGLNLMDAKRNVLLILTPKQPE